MSACLARVRPGHGTRRRISRHDRVLATLLAHRQDLAVRSRDPNALRVELYHAPYADGGRTSLRLLGQFIDRHHLLLAVMTQLTTGIFLTGYARGLRASSTVIGVLAGVPSLVNVSQPYLS